MPVPHLNIRIVQRSKGNSAVAGAAYQAGEKLFSEYDQKHKDHRRKQHEVVYTEIMLPTNAPPEYADRATLWNSAEEVEKQWNSQLARRFVVALPREVPLEMCPQMMQEYCNEYFVSKGMCCDFAIHDPDPPGHNPHCHIMLTMRAIDENGKWMPKSRKVYDLDENGERIKLPSGRWKSHKEDTVDWNEQYHAEEWRHGWEVIQNKYLELAGQLATVKEELQPMKDIRYWVGKVLTPEQAVEKKPEPKHSVTEKVKFLQEQGKKQPEQKAPQHKKQNMEL